MKSTDSCSVILVHGHTHLLRQRAEKCNLSLARKGRWRHSIASLSPTGLRRRSVGSWISWLQSRMLGQLELGMRSARHVRVSGSRYWILKRGSGLKFEHSRHHPENNDRNYFPNSWMSVFVLIFTVRWIMMRLKS